MVTPAELAAFVRQLQALDVCDSDSNFECQLKYGPQIDADERGTVNIVWDESGLGVSTDYPWDRDEKFSDLVQLAEALAADHQSLYRAHLSMGVMKPGLCEALTREPSVENEIGLYLGELSFEIGPITVAGLATEEPAFVGWMALKISGPGYYFPWSFRMGRDRAEAQPELQHVATVCRELWPVLPTPVTPERIAVRREVGELWLYELDQPTDWLWFASETG